MEISFQEVIAAFPKPSAFRLSTWTMTQYSNGIRPRLLAIREARRQRGDINHITGDVHFIALGLPRRSTILTIHDCGFMHTPGVVQRSFLACFWLLLPVWWCKYVTAVSEATKQDILRYTHCRADKVRVIPTVIAQSFQPVSRPFSAGRPRILHIGMAENKNFVRHVAALAGLPCSLFVLGQLQDDHHELLEKAGIDYESAYNLSGQEVAEVYAGSDLLLFASTLEGFGMPILEAQSVGRPVVTSNCSSMPEVAGAGACLVDPFSMESIRAGLLRVIEDADYRNGLVEAGFMNVQRFRPEAVAKAYAELYEVVSYES